MREINAKTLKPPMYTDNTIKLLLIGVHRCPIGGLKRLGLANLAIFSFRGVIGSILGV